MITPAELTGAAAEVAEPSLALPASGRLPSFCLALVGPDGVGKSTVIEILKRWVARATPQASVEVRQWRPGLLPALICWTGRPEPRQKTMRPRRTPGRFQFLRLAYYFLDFSIGHWWKARRSKAAVVIYDRCALDMAVDPVRFGLRSSRGTGLLWTLIPKPDLLVLLHDTPGRICARKQELEEHEVGAQLATWLELAEKGAVHAVVEIDAPPETVARRIWDLMTDALAAKSRVDDGPTSVAEPAWEAMTAGGAVSSERYAGIPAASRPRLLLPLSNRRVAASGCRLCHPQHRSARVAKRLLQAGFRAGLGSLWPARAQGNRQSSSGEQAGLIRLLETVLGRADLHLAVWLGTPSPHRKPVIQVMDGEGAVLAYAKIGWNQATVPLVQNEAAILRSLERHAFTTAAIPRVLHAGAWNGMYVLVELPSCSSRGSAPRRIDKKLLAFLYELRSERLLHWSKYHAMLENRAQRLGPAGFEYYAHVLSRALAYAHPFLAARPLPAVIRHGDLTPWNLRLDGGKLMVLDWEYAQEAGLPGWDLFHFIVETSVELEARPPASVVRELLGPSRSRALIEHHFHTMALSADLIGPLLAVYAAEALSGNLLRDGRAVSRQDARLRRTWSTLLTLLSYLSGLRACPTWGGPTGCAGLSGRQSR